MRHGILKCLLKLLLFSKDFVNFVSQQIDFFVSLNKTPDISASMLCKTLVAYTGEMLPMFSYSRYEIKLRKGKLTKLIQHTF